MRTRHLGWLAVGHPAQVIVGLFAGAIAVGTGLLMLPAATEGDGGASLSEAIFTATSAICVTGLIVVDTPTYWSGFGEWVILGLIQLGGLGIMTLASLLTMLLARRMGLRQRLTTLAETGVTDLGELRQLLKRIVAVTAVAEIAGAIVLAARFAWGYDASLPLAARLGVFHSVSAWNNAGFALFSDNLIGFVDDPFILAPIALLVIVGGLGFPVLVDLRARQLGWHRWSLHTKLTVFGTLALLAVGALVITALEWTNPDTLGPLSIADKLLAGTFSGVMPRTAGFNAIDLGHLESTTVLFHTLLMFIGAGSASTAGGIKVTTFVVLALIVWAEMRGNPDTSAFGRTIPGSSQRQAVTITAAAMAAVFLAVSGLLAVSDLPLEDVLFEAFSAFGTVGLSTGITPLLSESGRALIVGLMFLGRLGPLTLGTALLFNTRPRKYHLAEERPLIG